MPFAEAGRTEPKGKVQVSHCGGHFASGARPTPDSPFVHIVAFARFLTDPCRSRSGMLSAAMDLPAARRRCARPDCALVAAASFSYDYRTRTVWLDDGLAPAPSHHDLCGGHAERLRVPHGWQLIDRRAAVAPVVPAPAAR